MHNLGSEFLQTMAVQLWQRVNVVGCCTVFRGPIGMFAATFCKCLLGAMHCLASPSLAMDMYTTYYNVTQFRSELPVLYNVYYLKCIYAQSMGKYKTRCYGVADTITTLSDTVTTYTR